MAVKKIKRKSVEWVGGLITMPGLVIEGDESFCPESLFWLDSEGAAIGHALAKPGEVILQACQSLQDTTRAPAFGKPHTPDRVRVADLALAEALRSGQRRIEVVCAPTPEIDALAQSLRDKFARAEALNSYLSAGVDPARVAAFFEAAAALYDVQPWNIVPSDESLIRVSIESLGLHNAIISVIGQLGENFGVILFSGLDEFEAHLDAGDALAAGFELEFPASRSLNFESESGLSPALRQEITEHRWTVSGADAFPLLMAIAEEQVLQPLTENEYTTFETLALGLTKLLREEAESMRFAWDGGDVVSRTYVIPANGGEVEVSFTVPHDSMVFDTVEDLHQALLALGEEEELWDAELRPAIEQALLDRFSASPEASGLKDKGVLSLFLEFSQAYFNATVLTLSAHELREIIFEIVPRKVSVGSPKAGDYIAELRAFYRYLGREFGLVHAGECLEVLGEHAVAELEQALSDPKNFGLTKSLVMQGKDAGFDMNSKEGIEAWMREVVVRQSLRAPRWSPPALSTHSHQQRVNDASKKKNVRKAARRARKKNR